METIKDEIDEIEELLNKAKAWTANLDQTGKRLKEKYDWVVSRFKILQDAYSHAKSISNQFRSAINERIIVPVNSPELEGGECSASSLLRTRLASNQNPRAPAKSQINSLNLKNAPKSLKDFFQQRQPPTEDKKSQAKVLSSNERISKESFHFVFDLNSLNCIENKIQRNVHRLRSYINVTLSINFSESQSTATKQLPAEATFTASRLLPSDLLSSIQRSQSITHLITAREPSDLLSSIQRSQSITHLITAREPSLISTIQSTSATVGKFDQSSTTRTMVTHRIGSSFSSSVSSPQFGVNRMPPPRPPPKHILASSPVCGHHVRSPLPLSVTWSTSRQPISSIPAMPSNLIGVQPTYSPASSLQSALTSTSLSGLVRKTMYERIQKTISQTKQPQRHFHPYNVAPGRTTFVQGTNPPPFLRPPGMTQTMSSQVQYPTNSLAVNRSRLATCLRAPPRVRMMSASMPPDIQDFHPRQPGSRMLVQTHARPAAALTAVTTQMARRAQMIPIVPITSRAPMTPRVSTTGSTPISLATSRTPIIQTTPQAPLIQAALRASLINTPPRAPKTPVTSTPVLTIKPAPRPAFSPISPIASSISKSNSSVSKTRIPTESQFVASSSKSPTNCKPLSQGGDDLTSSQLSDISLSDLVCEMTDLPPEKIIEVSKARVQEPEPKNSHQQDSPQLVKQSNVVCKPQSITDLMNIPLEETHRRPTRALMFNNQSSASQSRDDYLNIPFAILCSDHKRLKRYKRQLNSRVEHDLDNDLDDNDDDDYEERDGSLSSSIVASKTRKL